jgi:MFS transporter, PAT family, beta-lactamase induction signal transducer AmpG
VKLRQKLFLVSLLYFAEGFPFGIIFETLPVYFRFHGMSLVSVGLLSLVSLPYALKFLWAPAVDFIGNRRQWIWLTQLLMAVSILAFLPFDPSRPHCLLWVCIASLAILSATQDIAIDAYTIELLKTPEMGIANGFRQAAYRAGMVLSGAVFVAFGGWMGWKATYLVAAAILVLCGIISTRLPRVERQHPAFSASSLITPARDFFSRPGFLQVGLFILLYRVGDLGMGPMVRPFWLDKGLTLPEVALIGGLGITASIAGGLVGGLFMLRFGVFHGLWFLGLWQSVSNLSYALVAAYPDCDNSAVYAASFIESFCSGLGTSAFLGFLMSVCKKEYAATQYAILSALFRIPGIICGSFSGVAASVMGYSQYFALTFLLSLPAYAFIFHAKAWIPPNGNDAEQTM